MNELSGLLDGDAATTVLFYGSVLCFVVFGAAVSWLQSAPVRRRTRWLRATAVR